MMFKHVVLEEEGIKTGEKNPGLLLGQATNTFKGKIDADFETLHLNVRTPVVAKQSICDLVLHVNGEITVKQIFEDLKKGGGGRNPFFQNQEQIEAFCDKNKAKLNKEGARKTWFFFEETIGGEKKQFVATAVVEGDKVSIFVEPMSRDKKYGPWEKTKIAFPQKPPAPAPTP
jgi:hypothetical protein